MTRKKEDYKYEEDEQDEDRTRIKCKFCSYVWATSSKMLYITCPNCQRKNKKLIRGVLK